MIIPLLSILACTRTSSPDRSTDPTQNKIPDSGDQAATDAKADQEVRFEIKEEDMAQLLIIEDRVRQECSDKFLPDPWQEICYASLPVNPEHTTAIAAMKTGNVVTWKQVQATCTEAWQCMDDNVWPAFEKYFTEKAEKISRE